MAIYRPSILALVVFALSTTQIFGCPCLKNIGYETRMDQFCGSDGYTYNSQAEASCVSSCYGYPITRKHSGACAVPFGCYCPPTGPSDPLCGSDGQTYENRQALDCNNHCKKQHVQKAFKGKCGGADIVFK